MRRSRRQPAAAFAFLGRELRWMALGVTTLVVLFLLISRLREDGAAAQRIARPAADEPSAAATIAKLPQPTGPTDEDEEEAEVAKGDFQALSDDTLGLNSLEMFSYNRLVSWVKSQTFARLWARAKKNLAYTYLYDDAQGHRGALVALDVEIRLVRDAGKNDAGVPLFEASATTPQSGNHLYELIIVDFPAKMPVNAYIREKARFAGYFLKVQGYQSGIAKPGGPPERAPLLIGRLDWKPTAAPAATVVVQDWMWVVAVLAILLAAWGARFVFWRREKPTAGRNTLTPPADGVIPVEAWLEQCTTNSRERGERKDETKEETCLTGGMVWSIIRVTERQRSLRQWRKKRRPEGRFMSPRLAPACRRRCRRRCQMPPSWNQRRNRCPNRPRAFSDGSRPGSSKMAPGGCAASSFTSCWSARWR
jgi:hypothetical protein